MRKIQSKYVFITGATSSRKRSVFERNLRVNQAFSRTCGAQNTFSEGSANALSTGLASQTELSKKKSALPWLVVKLPLVPVPNSSLTIFFVMFNYTKFINLAIMKRKDYMLNHFPGIALYIQLGTMYENNYPGLAHRLIGINGINNNTYITMQRRQI